jgi:hypothetical protein
VPAQLAPLANQPGSPQRKILPKRRKLDHTADTTTPRSTQPSNHNALIQTRVSAGLHVIKPRYTAISPPKATKLQTSLPSEQIDTTGAVGGQDKQSTYARSLATAYKVATKRRQIIPDEAAGEETLPPSFKEHYAETQSFDVITNDRDNYHYDQSHCDQLAGSDTIFDDEDFDDDINDEEFLKLTSDMIDTGSNVVISSSSLFGPDLPHKVRNGQRTSSSTNPPIVLDEPDSTTQRTAKKFVSPVTMTTRLLAVTGDVDRAEARKPIVRAPFPVAVRDRSPVAGLTSTSFLRTCFRIGEAINQAHQSSKTGKYIIFELYARIFDSQRDDTKQYFTFCDLFHGKQPYIKAVYEGAIWKSVQLFDYDSKRLLQQGRICRCIGTMKRGDRQWTMTVSNIWESTWEDIKWVEGIVNS